jgi:hypothetical protein
MDLSSDAALGGAQYDLNRRRVSARIFNDLSVVEFSMEPQARTRSWPQSLGSLDAGVGYFVATTRL